MKTLQEFLDIENTTSCEIQEALQDLSEAHPVFKSNKILQVAIRSKGKKISARELQSITRTALERLKTIYREMQKSDPRYHALYLAEQNLIMSALIVIKSVILLRTQHQLDKAILIINQKVK